MSFTSILKVVGGVFITILLGAIGSGVWENVLSPGLDWMYRTSVDLVSSVSLDYKDGIYEKAALGFHEDFSFRLFSIVIMLLSLSLLIWASSKLSHTSEILKRAFDTNKIRFQLIVKVLVLSFVLYTFYANGRNEAVQNVRSYSLISLEILHPHVGEERFIQLKSDFLQIRTAAEFYNFNNVIVSEAKSYNVLLPDFNPI